MKTNREIAVSLSAFICAVMCASFSPAEPSSEWREAKQAFRPAKKLSVAAAVDEQAQQSTVELGQWRQQGDESIAEQWRQVDASSGRVILTEADQPRVISVKINAPVEPPQSPAVTSGTQLAVIPEQGAAEATRLTKLETSSRLAYSIQAYEPTETIEQPAPIVAKKSEVKKKRRDPRVERAARILDRLRRRM